MVKIQILYDVSFNSSNVNGKREHFHCSGIRNLFRTVINIKIICVLGY
jgi:hypothetical protein